MDIKKIFPDKNIDLMCCIMHIVVTSFLGGVHIDRWIAWIAMHTACTVLCVVLVLDSGFYAYTLEFTRMALEQSCINPV